MRYIIFIFLVIGLNSCKETASTDEFEPSENLRSVLNKSSVSYFIPANYSILDSSICDLNNDTFSDYILILKQNGEDSLNNSFVRPCIILLGNEKKEFDLYFRNDSIVLCYDCGGMMGDPYVGLETKKGEFTISHYGGSNWKWSNIMTFRFNQNDKKIYLEKIDNASYNLSLIEDGSENLDDFIEESTERLTNKDFGKITFEQFVND